MIWVAVVRRYHAVSTAATVPTAIQRSVAVVRKRLQLRIAVHHAQVLVGDEALGRRRLGKGAVRLHELADAGEPLVDFGGRAAGAAHDLQLPGEVVDRPRVEL